MNKNIDMSYNANTAFKNTIFLGSLLSFIGFSMAFRALNVYDYFHLGTFLEDVPKGSSYIISIAHGFFSFLFAFFYLKKYISFKTWYKLLSFSIGYFIFDISRYIFLDEFKLDNNFLQGPIHHMLVLVIIINYIPKYPRLSALGFLSELSTFFLGLSWLMYKADLTTFISFRVICILTLVTYVWPRIYNFTKIIVELYRRKAPKIELIGFSTIVIASYYWFWLLVRLFLKLS